MSHVDRGISVIGNARVHFCRYAALDNVQNLLSKRNCQIFKRKVRHILILGAAAQVFFGLQQDIIHNLFKLRHLRRRRDQGRVGCCVLRFVMLNRLDISGISYDNRHFSKLF